MFAQWNISNGTMIMKKYRLYIDEVGNSDVNSSNDPNHQYFSLTGVIAELGYVKDILHPKVESLKSIFFNSHPDEPIILHRKELVNKKYPFNSLLNKDTENEFNKELLALLKELEYQVITVVIDKSELLSRYKVWRYDPYHYALAVMLERYTQWLLKIKITGDVLAEARGGKEDLRLKNSFENLFEKGTDYVSANIFQNALTSKQIKVKPKFSNIAGLQLADILAHPSYKATISKELPKNFGGEIVKILEKDKYLRNNQGKVDGYGRKILP
jgi:hypothetical protein